MIIKIFFIIVLYLALILVMGWCLIKSYDLFLGEINKKVAIQTVTLKSEINLAKSLKATNPASIKDIQEYDQKHNTNFYNLVQNHPSLLMGYVDMAQVNSFQKFQQVSPKEMISNVLEEVIAENELKIANIEHDNKGFWSELPPWSTLLLAGIGIFLTSLITNFGIFCSGLIASFFKWIFD